MGLSVPRISFVFAQKTDRFQFVGNSMRSQMAQRRRQSHPHICAFGSHGCTGLKAPFT